VWQGTGWLGAWDPADPARAGQRVGVHAGLTPLGFWLIRNVFDEKLQRSGGTARARRQRGVPADSRHVPRRRWSDYRAWFGKRKGELFSGLRPGGDEMWSGAADRAPRPRHTLVGVHDREPMNGGRERDLGRRGPLSGAGLSAGTSIPREHSCGYVCMQDASGERERLGAARQSRWLHHHDLGVLTPVHSPVCA
jgi:hypothetical protein